MPHHFCLPERKGSLGVLGESTCDAWPHIRPPRPRSPRLAGRPSIPEAFPGAVLSVPSCGFVCCPPSSCLTRGYNTYFDVTLNKCAPSLFRGVRTETAFHGSEARTLAISAARSRLWTAPRHGPRVPGKGCWLTLTSRLSPRLGDPGWGWWAGPSPQRPSSSPGPLLAGAPPRRSAPRPRGAALVRAGGLAPELRVLQRFTSAHRGHIGQLAMEGSARLGGIP